MRHCLVDQVVLVTGGEGCVGSCLIKKLITLGASFKALSWEMSETMTIAISALEELLQPPPVTQSFKLTRDQIFPTHSNSSNHHREIGLTAYTTAIA